MNSLLDHYSKEFEQGVRGLCSKYYDIINDPMFEYVDLMQEVEIMIFEQEATNKRFIKMPLNEKEKYLFLAIKYQFIDFLNTTNRRRSAEETSSGED